MIYKDFYRDVSALNLPWLIGRQTWSADGGFSAAGYEKVTVDFWSKTSKKTTVYCDRYKLDLDSKIFDWQTYIYCTENMSVVGDYLYNQES